MKDLTLTEEIVLLAVWKLKEDAYGVAIRKELSESTKRIFPYGTLYSALDQLTRKGFITKSSSDPLPKRGGRRRYYYSITPEGVSALKTALELKKIIWDRKTILALDKS
jgi:PadR family transcriptional regulator PadR